MTCSDCIHVYVCENAFCWIDPNDSNKKTTCVHFKPKSRYIELPCAVGDTAYRIVEMGTGIKYKFLGKYEGGESRGCKIAPCEEKTKRFIRSVTVTKNNLLDVCENFGKTVFLTKEEAEKALAERNEG